MEEKTQFESPAGKEIYYEEEDDIFDEDKTRPRPSEKHHLALWLSIILAVLVILIGWAYFTKMSFTRIDERLQLESQISNEEAAAQFQASLKGFGEMLEEIDDDVDQIKEKDQAKKQEAQALQDVGDKMVDDIKEPPVEPLPVESGD
jgi:uncharacterized protein HemX